MEDSSNDWSDFKAMASSNVTNVYATNVSSAPSHCASPQSLGEPAAFHPDSVVSAQAEDLVRRWKDLVFLPVLVLIGGPANLINMAVFYRQGLRERINVCLFALSMADFLYLLEIIVFLGENIQLDRRPGYGPVASYMINHNLIGFYGFTWVSQILSAFIASERCFCVMQPLRSQTVLRTSTTVVIVVVVNVVVVGLYLFVVFRYRVACVYDPVSGDSFMFLTPGKFYLDNQKVIDYLDGFVYGAGLPVLTMVVVTAATIITTTKLMQAAEWRAGTSSSSLSSKGRGGMSSKEVAVTKMLVGSSLLFLVCVFPIALFRITWLFLPEMNLGRSQQNLFLVCLWLLDVVSWVNSSFNIVVYYVMGSRYRSTFCLLFGRKVKAKVNGSEAVKAPETSVTQMTDS